MAESSPRQSGQPNDPVYLHTRREALVILVLWATALVWVVGYCYFDGYGSLQNADELRTIIGIPRWVFWGIFVPWLVCDVIAIGLCLWFIADDDLDAERTEPDARQPG